MKRCSISFIIRELQIKIMRRYHYTPIRMAKIKYINTTRCWQGCKIMGTLIHCWWECKMVQPLWKTVWQFLTKLNILLPYDPAITFLGIYPNELKTYVHIGTCTRMFIAALFITAKTWKRPRWSSIGDWINKLWYIQTMKYYSTVKRNELSTHENGTLNAYCQVKEANLKRLHTVWFQLYDLQEKTNCGDVKIKISGCQGFGAPAPKVKSEQVKHRWSSGQWKYFVWYYI